jgi:hypothetical protein
MNLMSLKRGLYLATALLPLFATAAHAACIPAVFPNGYLQQQENAGGHTIARHVGKTDQELVNRLIAQPRIAKASSYGVEAVAETDIEAALAANRVAINQWANAAGVAKRDWDSDRGHTVGRVASRPPSLANIADTSSLKVVIKRTARDTCYLLTSYPIP